jgi:ribosomal protein L7/L12/endogenous inhibitor of DNA gyrase (YacG/DUF329 family)
MAQKPCPACGAPVDVDERACPYCGAAIVGGSDPTLLGGLGSVAPDVFSEVREQIKRGKKIEAIRIYREITGSSLKDAKDAVQAIELGRPVPAPAQAAAGGVGAAAFASSAEAMDEIKRLLRSGNKIEAIRVHREAFNTGLKDAKDAVDAIESDLRFQAAPARRPVVPAVGDKIDLGSFSGSSASMGANSFDEPKQPPAWRNWVLGCLAALFLFCCLCVGLPALLYMFTGGQTGGF